MEHPLYQLCHLALFPFNFCCYELNGTFFGYQTYQKLIELYSVGPQALKTVVKVNEIDPQASLDRGLRVLMPNQARRQVNLPPDFFNITAEELKREQQAR